MGMIDNEGLAKLKGSLDENFKIGGVARVTIITGTVTNVVRCGIVNHSVWKIVWGEIG